MKDNLKITGHLKIYKNGILIENIPNLVVDSGKEWITNRLIDTNIPDAMSHMAIGTNNSGSFAASTESTNVVNNYNWSVNNESFYINANNGVTKLITLTANTTTKTQIINHINLKLSLALISSVQAYDLGNAYIGLRTTNIGPNQTFILTNGTPNVLTRLGFSEGIYTGTGVLTTETALKNEVQRETINTFTVTNNSIQYLGEFTTLTFLTIGEAGLFNDVTSGTMLARTVFNNITFYSTELLSIIWTITIN